MKILRVLRAMASTALVWSIANVPLMFGLVGIVLLLGGNTVRPEHFGLLAISAASTGALNGAAFAMLLALTGRKRSFDMLTVPALMLCGAIGGLVLPAITLARLGRQIPEILTPMMIASGLGVSCAIGAASAAATLYAARRAPPLASGTPVKELAATGTP